MTLKEHIQIFLHYKVPRFINKYFRRVKISEKGLAFFDYCVKVFQDENYEAENYQEIMFDKMIERLREKDGTSRKTAAAIYMEILMPYLNIRFVEGENSNNVDV